MLICGICGAFNYFTIDDYVIHRDTFTIFEDTFLFPSLNMNITQNDVRYRRFFQAHYFDRSLYVCHSHSADMYVTEYRRRKAEQIISVYKGKASTGLYVG